MLVIVGRIGRAHGIKGEVGMDVRTDEPDRRFADGETVVTDAKVLPFTRRGIGRQASDAS